MFAFKNFTKGWFTSFVGLLLIGAGLYSVLGRGTSWAEAGVVIGIGVTLLGLPDPKLPGSATGAVGVLVLVGLTLGGCVSYQRCLDKYGTPAAPTTLALSDTVRVPVTVTTPADSLTAAFALDSLAAAPATGDTLHLASAGGRVRLAVWKSPAAPGARPRLHLRATVPPQIIHDTVSRYVTLYGQCPPAYTLAPAPGFWQRCLGYYRTGCTVLVSGLLLWVLVLLVLRRVRPPG